MSTVHHAVRAVLGFKTGSIPILMAGARNVYSKMSADTAQYPSPDPTMPQYLGLITDVDAAQPLVHSRTRGATSPRNVKAGALVTGSKRLLGYVQSLADTSPEIAAQIIVNSGFKVAGVSLHALTPVMLKNGKPTGTVIVRAFVKLLTGGSKAAVSFSWSYSVDGEKTWINLPVTPIGRTLITGLTALTTVAVRVAVTVGKLPIGEWSPASTLIVL